MPNFSRFSITSVTNIFVIFVHIIVSANFSTRKPGHLRYHSRHGTVETSYVFIRTESMFQKFSIISITYILVIVVKIILSANFSSPKVRTSSLSLETRHGSDVRCYFRKKFITEDFPFLESYIWLLFLST